MPTEIEEDPVVIAFGRRSVRSLAVGAVLAGALAGCSAGNLAQTSEMVPPVVGVNEQIGPIALRDVHIAYNGPGGYPKGGTAPLVVRLFNTGTTPVKLVGVTAHPAAEKVLLVGSPTATTSPAPTESPTGSP